MDVGDVPTKSRVLTPAWKVWIGPGVVLIVDLHQLEVGACGTAYDEGTIQDSSVASRKMS